MLIFDSQQLLLNIVSHDYLAWHYFVSLYMLSSFLAGHIVFGYPAWLYIQFWRYPLALCLILLENLANSEHPTNYSCIFVLYVPSVEVDIDVSKLYGNCLDTFRMDTYENGNEHEIMLSLIQLSGSSTSLHPDPGKSTNSNANEQSKSETGVTSQEPSCKKPFTGPDTLTKMSLTIPIRFTLSISLFSSILSTAKANQAV